MDKQYINVLKIFGAGPLIINCIKIIEKCFETGELL